MARITRDLENVLATGPAAWLGWLPLMVLPLAAVLAGFCVTPWAWMWLLALSLGFGCKWLTWWTSDRRGNATAARQWAYFLAWPGMNARHFLDDTNPCPRPPRREWFFAAGKTFLGAAVLWGLPRVLPDACELLTGWVGLVGLVLVLHFGLFHLLALCWRRAGVAAPPIMRAPLRATSVSEFWNQRWNVAFHQLMDRFVFRPLARKTNIPIACLAGFLASGLIHDLVISVPARGGYGRPTAYFLAQGCAVLLERRHGLRGNWRGWIFTMIVTAAPLGWLFHPPFIRNVILPMLHAIGATSSNL